MVLKPVESRKPLRGHLLWFLIWLAVTLIAIKLTPSPTGHGTHTELGLPPCPSMLLFGKPCPGCGLTTSFTATVHGQFGAAFHAHPLGPILYGLFTVTAWLCLYGFIKQRQMPTDTRAYNFALCFLMIGFFIFGVFRFIETPQVSQTERLPLPLAYHR